MGRAFGDGGLGAELAAAGGDGVLQHGEVGVVAVGEGGVEQGPEALGRLEFGGVRRQEGEVQAVRDGEAGAGVPTRVVQHQHDPRGRPHPDIPGERRQHLAHRGGVDRREEPPIGAPARRVGEAVDVIPT